MKRGFLIKLWVEFSSRSVRGFPRDAFCLLLLFLSAQLSTFAFHNVWWHYKAHIITKELIQLGEGFLQDKNIET